MRKWLSLVALVSLAPPALAQESRGTLTGTVTDPQGAVVPNAKVEVKSSATNTVATIQTSDRGVYTLPALNPGLYIVTVTAAGFKNSVHSNVDVRVAERRQLDITMEIGTASESITISSEAPLLETASASGGTVINKDLVASLPLLGSNSFAFMEQTSGAYQYQPFGILSERPFDNGGMDNYSINGGPAGGNNNRFLIDGISNNNNEGLGFVPPQSAVNEFKLMTNLYDAEYGKTGGGVANVSLKNGTNQFHGTANFNFRNEHLNANLFQTNLAHAANLARDPTYNTKKTRYYWLNPSATVSGPVYLPHLYNGKSKSFFMFSWEQLRDGFPAPSNRTYPTTLEKQGNFSQSFTDTARTRVVQLYDPLTTQCDAALTVCTRTIFPGSVIPSSRQDPFITKFMKYYPEPQFTNVPLGAVNYVATPSLQGDLYNAYLGRFDHTITSKHSIFVSWEHGNRREIINNSVNMTGELALAYPVSGTWRINDGAGFNLTSVFTPTLISTVKVNFLRHDGLGRYTEGADFDPTTQGYSAQLKTLVLGAVGMPSFAAAGYSSFGGTGNVSSTLDNSWTLAWTLTKVRGAHSIKGGFEGTLNLRNQLGNNLFPGISNFAASYTQGYDAGRATLTTGTGNGLATALLGYPGGSSFTPTVQYAYASRYYAVFFQDDYRVNQRLTLNLGIRYDLQTPFSERYDRQVVGFDPSATFAVNGVSVKGAPLWATGSNRYPTRVDTNNIGPRVGVAYRLRSKTVLRGGWGVTYAPNAPVGVNTGFSVATNSNLTSVNGNGRVPITGADGWGLLHDGGSALFTTLNTPPGRQLKAPTVGGDITYSNPDARSVMVQQFNFGVQFELPGRSVLNVEYNGSHSRDVAVSRSFNNLTRDTYLALGSGAGANVPNPFGPVSGTGTCLQSSVMSLSRTYFPYPQFCQVNITGIPLGKLWYNSLQTRWEKRLTHGVTSLVNFTWGKTMQQSDYFNAAYDDITALRRAISAQDQKFHLSLTMSYVVPFGRQGLTANKAAKSLTKYALGGWTISGIANFQTGLLLSTPIDGSPVPGFASFTIPTGNLLQSTGVDPSKPTSAWSGPTLERWFNTCTIGLTGARQSCASADEPAAWQIFPIFSAQSLAGISPRFASLKTSRPPNADISIFKAFPIKEKVQFQLTAQAFNLTNTPAFGYGSNGAGIITTTQGGFGSMIKSQGNVARTIQVAGTVTW